MITLPSSVVTSILPVMQSFSKSVQPLGQLGNKIIVLRPSSSTVAVKSVPRTPIVAVGVLIATACGLFLATCPDA